MKATSIHRRYPDALDTAAVAVVAVVLGLWRLSLNGLGNAYYTAADISGAHSMRNLFFAAFDRQGIMAVDKPPLGLVPPAVAVRFFGISSWTILGPQVILFSFGVAILHRALLRWFNRSVATIAALVMLATPINIAVARSNNPDELLVLLTIVGVVLAVEAVRRDALRWAVGAAMALGLAFTTKQLQAIVGVPAILVALAVLSPGSWRRRLTRTGVFGATAIVSCLAWIMTVDHVAPSHRPYVSNSTNDTEFRLAFGFNGTHRVGKFQGQGGSPSTHAISRAMNPFGLWHNLVDRRDIQQGTWLLLAAVVGASIALRQTRRRTSERTTASVLLLWTAIHAAVLTITPGKFSPYYLAPLVPGIAALVGFSLDALLNASREAADRTRAHLGLATMLAIAAVTASIAATPTERVVLLGSGASFAVMGLIVNRARLGRSLPLSRPLRRRAGLTAIVMTLLLTPAQWSYADVSHAQDSVVPHAALRSSSVMTTQASIIAENDRRILSYARRHTPSGHIVLATSRIMLSALSIEKSSQPVAPLGGFFGTDQFPKLPTFTSWVRRGFIRWVAVPALPPRLLANRLPPSIVASPWGPFARTHCRRVPAKDYGGLNATKYWFTHDVGPLHSPLALYDCQSSSS